jgi:subtilase family serine protease
MHFKFHTLIFVLLLILLSACDSARTDNPAKTTIKSEHCPAIFRNAMVCYTPQTLRSAYDVNPLIQKGFTGKGQTILDVVSYGSPTLQQDLNTFDTQFGLPHLQVQTIAPLGTALSTSQKHGTGVWALETDMDVEIMHTIAPDAHIVVLASPVNETEGTIGLPQFLALEQYAVTHHLGNVISQSWSVSEATLADSPSQQFIKQYSDFYQQITLHQGITIVSSTGDNGATNVADISSTRLATTPTVNFPADVPWVTAIGGTSLAHTTAGYTETAWVGSGGGKSAYFAEPAFQNALPHTIQVLLANHHGLPDVAADADSFTGMAFYVNGQWMLSAGTSASTPVWAALLAIADQMAKHPLGFVNPGIYKLGLLQHVQRDFRDITQGNNTVTHGLPGQSSLHVQGYQAMPGWDAVTCWGSPLASQIVPDLVAALSK